MLRTVAIRGLRHLELHALAENTTITSSAATSIGVVVGADGNLNSSWLMVAAILSRNCVMLMREILSNQGFIVDRCSVVDGQWVQGDRSQSIYQREDLTEHPNRKRSINYVPADMKSSCAKG